MPLLNWNNKRERERHQYVTQTVINEMATNACEHDRKMTGKDRIMIESKQDPSSNRGSPLSLRSSRAKGKNERRNVVKVKIRM